MKQNPAMLLNLVVCADFLHLTSHMRQILRNCETNGCQLESHTLTLSFSPVKRAHCVTVTQLWRWMKVVKSFTGQVWSSSLKGGEGGGGGYQTTCASDGCVYSGIKGSFQQNWIHCACIMNNSCLAGFSLDKRSADPEPLSSWKGKGQEYSAVLDGIYIVLYWLDWVRSSQRQPPSWPPQVWCVIYTTSSHFWAALWY